MLAATRAGIEIVVLPKDNEKDLADIPSYARDKLQFVLVDRVDDVVAAVFDGAPEALPQEAVAGSSGSGEGASSAEPATQTAAGKKPAARDVRARKKD